MGNRWGRWRVRAALALAAGLAASAGAIATPADDGISVGSAYLLAVLRDAGGDNQPDETLRPWGKVVIELDNGSEMEVEASWFHYLGDLQLRLVFDGPQKLQSATPEDLRQFRLDPQQALQLAMRNLRRLYGEPQVSPWQDGLLRVDGRASDLSSSYLLDRDFWVAQEREHPAGLVAAVPLRGALLFTPADDEQAVQKLRFSAVALHAIAGPTGVSSGLYLFKNGRWSVFQPPVSRRLALSQ